MSPALSKFVGGSRVSAATLVAGLSIFLLYCCLATRNYYWDGISFAQAIEDARGLEPSLLNPNHLIYNGLGYVFHRAASALFPGVRALTVLQVVNSAAGVLSAWLLFRILACTTGSLYVSACLALLLCFSSTWWKYSTDADSYILSVLFLLIASRALFTQAEPNPWLVGASHASAMLIHQLAFLFLPVAIVRLAGAGTQKRPHAVWKYLATAALVVPAYLAGFYFFPGRSGWDQFFPWLTSHATDVAFSFDVLGNSRITLLSYARLFVGGRASLMLRFFSPLTVILLGVLTAALALLVYRVVRYRLDLRVLFGAAPRRNPVFFLAGCWWACYGTFLFFWLPRNTFYKLFCLPAMLLLAGAWLTRYDHARPGPRRYRTALLVAVVAIANFTFSIFPYSHASASPVVDFALGMQRIWSDRTIVYYVDLKADNWYMKYFNPRTTWRRLPDSGFATPPEADIWIDSSALGRLTSNEALLPGRIVERRELVTPRHNIRFARLAIGPNANGGL